MRNHKLTTLSTHKGLFVFERISYGIAFAPGILQREMENVLRNIDGAVAFYGEIIISGKSEKEVCDTQKGIKQVKLLGLLLEKTNV